MSHIHDYDELYDRVKERTQAALTNTKEMAVESRVVVLSRTILDYVLEELGVKVESPIPYEPSDD